jgi:hypothetical protein
MATTPAQPEAPAPAAEGEAVPDWLQELRATMTTEPVQPPAEEAVPDWLKQLGSPVKPEAEEPVAQEATPDWLVHLREQAGLIPGEPVEAEPPEPPVEGAPLEAAPQGPPETAEFPDWLQALGPESAQQPVQPSPAAAPEPAEIPDWLHALKPAGAEQPVPPLEQALGTPDWLTELGAGAAAAPAEEAEGDLGAPEPGEVPDWLKALGPSGTEPAPVTPAAPEPESPAWLTGEGPMPSPEEAMAYFQKLTAGKEAELQATAQADAEARMADIMGRKPTAAPAPKPAPPAPVMPPEVVPPPPVVEVPAPLAGQGAVPSPEEALEYLHKITAGKEAELRAQAEAEARLADVTRRQPAPAPEPAPAESEKGAPAEAALPEAETPDWLAVLMQPEAAPAPPVAAPPLVSIPVLPAEPAPEGEARVVAEPQAAGPEWWYQTREDEEGPIEELAVEQPPVKVEPIKIAPVEPVVSFVPPPPPAAAPKPAAPPSKKLVRAKPAAPAPPTVDMDALLARLRANPADYDALLGMARGWTQTADLNAARGAYDELVRAGALLDEVLSDLGQFAEDHPDDVEFIRLLGDAHMKAGNLQKALKLYRQALRKL